MRALSKGPEPQDLTDARESKSDWSSLYSSQKNSIRQQIVADQNAICAFCEGPVSETIDVDHFHPQQGHSRCINGKKPDDGNWSLTWSNLVGTCDGPHIAPEATGCNRRKKNDDLCDRLFDPYQFPTDALVVVHRDGSLRVTCPSMDPSFTEEFLNHLALREKRASFIAEIETFASTSTVDELLDLVGERRSTPFFESTFRSLFGT